MVSSGGHLTVRVNTGALPLRMTDGAPFDLLTAVGTLKRAGAMQSWSVVAVGDGIVFTAFPEPAFTTSQILEWCRVRWQVEPLFKRFKSLAQLGHVPKYDDDSARAWLYGKLLVALLAEKLLRHASAVSLWGYDLAAPPAQPVA